MSKSIQVPQIDSFDEAISMYLNEKSEDGIKKSDYPSTYKKKIDTFHNYLTKCSQNKEQ